MLSALVRQTAMPFAEALPKSALYSDTGIMLSGTSDIYAVEDDGRWRDALQSRAPRRPVRDHHHGRRDLEAGNGRRSREVHVEREL